MWHVSSCINQYSVLTFHFPRLSSRVIGDYTNTPLNSTLGSDVMINTNTRDVANVLGHGHPSFLWQMVTPDTVGWFVSPSWKK